ncbi:MAG TPA: hypothetical protein VK976_04745 [Verrucomicrobiae bacterium]|jgi:hypothetical protein|nr:hypothetical protein [Verrucomicrobiae bacterium]
MKPAVAFVSFVLVAAVANAQQQPISQIYKQDILDARTIAVVAYPSSAAGDSQENQRSRLEVQNAMRQWGKYQVVADASVADLIMVVRKGHAQAATIGGPTGTSPATVDPLGSGVNIGVHRGQNPTLSRSDSSQISSQPRSGSEVGSPDDLLEVYRGRQPLSGDGSRDATQYPLDEPAVWTYTAKDALKSPKIEAVAEFRKAVEAAEKKKP